MTGMRNSGQRRPEPKPRFKLAMRGYDPHEVETFLGQLSGDPDTPVPDFARTLRGYDPQQVDMHIQQLKALRPKTVD